MALVAIDGPIICLCADVLNQQHAIATGAKHEFCFANVLGLKALPACIATLTVPARPFTSATGCSNRPHHAQAMFSHTKCCLAHRNRYQRHPPKLHCKPYSGRPSRGNWLDWSYTTPQERAYTYTCTSLQQQQTLSYSAFEAYKGKQQEEAGLHLAPSEA